jgi:hypothetical protein
MDLHLPLAMALLGLASGVHCVGMCGGIVGAFSARPVIPIVASEAKAKPEWQRQLLFNLGRISSYAAAGALAGIAGSAGALAAGMLPAQSAMLVIANVVLILIGLQLAGRSRWLARLEAFGAPLWRRIQPLAATLLQARRATRVYFGGLLWGLLPCGLVYGALVLAAALSASALEGASAMLAFGIGTLPNLFAAGLAAARLRTWFKRPAMRTGAGVAVLAFGVYGLANAAGVAEGIRRGILCI